MIRITTFKEKYLYISYILEKQSFESNV